MRRLAPLLILLLTAAAPPAPQPGTVIDAGLYGLDGRPTTDAAAALQLLLNALPDPAGVVIELPAGTHALPRPGIVTRHGVTIRGKGRGVTRLQPLSRFPALIAARVGDAAGDGARFSTAGRPDVFGLADASLAPSPGQAFGFDTQGRTALYFTGTPLDLGWYVPDWGWDYWGAAKGLTVEGLVRGTFAPGEAICGLGTTSDPVGPGVLRRNSSNPNALTLSLAIDDEPEGVTHDVSFDTGAWPSTLRFRVVVDPPNNAVNCWVNGKAYPPSWYGPAPTLTGRTLRLNRRSLPYLLGTSSQDVPAGAVPKAVWGGFRLSAVPKQGAPANDRVFATDEPGVVAFLDVARRPDPGRLVAFRGGQAAQGFSGYGLALDTLTTPGGLGDFVVEDLSVVGGSPGVLLANTFNTEIRRVKLTDGTRGIACLRAGVNYPIKLEDSTLTGTGSALDLYGAFGVAVNLTVASSGLTTVNLSGSGLLWQGLFSSSGRYSETAVNIWGDVDYASWNRFDAPVFDNEIMPYSVANFRAETQPAGAASLSIEGGGGSWVAAGRPVLLLTSRPGRKAGSVRVFGFDFPAGDPVPVRVDGPPGCWAGSVGLPGAVPPAGLTPAAARRGGEGAGFDAGVLLVK